MKNGFGLDREHTDHAFGFFGQHNTASVFVDFSTDLDEYPHGWGFYYPRGWCVNIPALSVVTKASAGI